MDFAPLSKTSRVKPYRFASGRSVSVRRPVCLFPCQSYVVGSRALCSWSLSVVGCASALGALPPHLSCAASDRSGWKTPVSQARSAWGCLVPDPVRDRTACGALVCGYAGVSVLLSVWLAMGPQGIHQAKIEMFRLRSRGVKSHRPDPPRIRMF